MTRAPTPAGGDDAERIDRLIAADRYDEAEAALSAQQYGSLSPTEQADRHQRRAFIACQRGEHATALGLFRDAVHAFPDAWKLRFGEAQERGHTGDIDGMFGGFEQMRFPNVTADVAMAQARYAYVFERPDEGIAALLPLLDVILTLRIGDSTFLAIRRLPDTETVWESLGCFHEERGRVDEFADLTDRITRTMFDIDDEGMRRFLQCVRSGDFEPEVQRLWPDPRASTKRPDAYLAMRAACTSEMTGCCSVRLVDDVHVEPGGEYPNYRWLEDVRTLVHAERARRDGDATKAAALASSFLRSQPLLFEPWLSFAFRLAPAQGHLRARARASFGSRSKRA